VKWDPWRDVLARVAKIVAPVPARSFVVARSLIAARSGMSPMYQNTSDTVMYVETAKKSQRSGLRKFGQRLIWLGIGAAQ